jgi:hypothetical protein
MTVMQKKYWTGAEFANTESNTKKCQDGVVAQTRKPQGVRRPFERIENYVPAKLAVPIFAKAQRNSYAFSICENLAPCQRFVVGCGELTKSRQEVTECQVSDGLLTYDIRWDLG